MSETTKLRRWLTLWVVEMWVDKPGQWEPTTGSALTKDEARIVRREWKDSNPYDRFRVSPYVRGR